MALYDIVIGLYQVDERTWKTARDYLRAIRNAATIGAPETKRGIRRDS